MLKFAVLLIPFLAEWIIVVTLKSKSLSLAMDKATRRFSPVEVRGEKEGRQCLRQWQAECRHPQVNWDPLLGAGGVLRRAGLGGNGDVGT